MTHDSGLPLDQQLTALQSYIDWTDIVIFIGIIGLVVVGIWKLKHRKKVKQWTKRKKLWLFLRLNLQHFQYIRKIVMKKVFTVPSVIGLIIVVIFVALEFTGVINFIDYRP